MAAFNLGQVLGDAAQGFMAGEDRGQVRRGNEQKMQQSAVAASDAHSTSVNQNKIYAEQIKASQIANKVTEANMPNALQVAEFNNKKWEAFNNENSANNVKRSIVGVMKSGSRGTAADYKELNKQAAESKSFNQMFGSQFDMGNSQNPEDYQQARTLMAGGDVVAATEADPYFDEKVKKAIDEGIIIKGHVNGQPYMVDVDSLQAISGAYMSPEDRENWEKKQMGVLDSKNYIGKGGGGGSLTQQLEIYSLKRAQGTMTERDYIEEATATKELKIEKPRAISRLSGPSGKDYRDQVSKGIYNSDMDASIDAMIADENLVGGSYKLSEDERKATYGKVPLYRESQALLKKMEGFEAEELMTGAVDDIAREVLTSFEDKTFEQLTQAQQLQVLDTVALTTQAGTLFADYVKIMSGAAVAEQEFDRLSKIFYGGKQGRVNIKTMQAALNGWSRGIHASVKGTAQSMSTTNPGTAGDVLRELGRVGGRLRSNTEIVGKDHGDVALNTEQVFEKGGEIASKEATLAGTAFVKGMGKAAWDGMASLLSLNSKDNKAVQDAFSGSDNEAYDKKVSDIKKHMMYGGEKITQIAQDEATGIWWVVYEDGTNSPIK